MKKIWLISSIVLFFFFFYPRLWSVVYAIRFSLIAPSGQLYRGQTVRFTITIDTQGVNVTSTQIGMTYDTQYLEYVGVTAGDAMTAVSASQLGGGRLLLSGENSSGFTGQGTFAYVDLKIIATAPGATELCVLWAPSVTPSPQPTTPLPTIPYSTATPIAPTSPYFSPYPTNIYPTTPPQVTALPTSGATEKTRLYSYVGLGSITLFALFFAVNLITGISKKH